MAAAPARLAGLTGARARSRSAPTRTLSSSIPKPGGPSRPPTCISATSSRPTSALNCAAACAKPGCAANQSFAPERIRRRAARQRAGAPMKERAQRAIAECRRIATMSEEPGRITRRFLTPPVREVHAHLRGRMEALGMTVSVDAAGNLRGLGSRRIATRQAADHRLAHRHRARCRRIRRRARRTWRSNACEIAQELKLPLPIEVIAFSEEEGVRFGVPFIGSRAVAGRFDPALLELERCRGRHARGRDPRLRARSRRDRRSCSRRQTRWASSRFTLNRARCSRRRICSVAAVTAIVGQTRLTLTLTGHANHAGTTPMHLRRDALAGAAEWIVAVESLAQRTEGLVATVGKVDVEPNAGNVIAGAVRVSLDVRHSNDLRAQRRR